MNKVKVLMLGGKAVGVVDGGCELVEVPVVGCKGFALEVPFECGVSYEPGVPIKIVGGGGPVTVEGVSGVDYKAEVKAYVDSVPEGGLLIPGHVKKTCDYGVYACLAGGDYKRFLGPFDSEKYTLSDEAAWYFLRLDLRRQP